MKKIFIILAVLAGIALLVVSQQQRITTTLLAKGLESRISADRMTELEDGLHLALCGAGGPLPAPTASGPCVAVIAGERMFVVDSGTDGVRNLGRMGYSAGRIEAVFLTHFHSDHIDGLGELATLRWVSAGNTEPLPVFGPTGVERVVDGFNLAYSQDQLYRHEHHGDTVAPLSGWGMKAQAFTLPEPRSLALLYDEDDLQIAALAVEHNPVKPAAGYKFTYKGRSLLITGDTIKSANIEHFANGVDLLVHEALAPNLVNMMNKAANNTGNPILAKVTYDILDYHASPMEAAETARDAGVGHLLYYHIVPPLVIPGQKALYLNGAGEVFPDYSIGVDGMSFSLPANSAEIIRTASGL